MADDIVLTEVRTVLAFDEHEWLVIGGRTARLTDEGGLLVATGETTINDETVRALIDSGRR